MTANGRGVHLVGSLPAPDAEQAMRTALHRLGDQLRTVPDGETGERRNWIVHIVESLRAHPDLEVVRHDDWSDYDHTTRLKVRRGHQLHGDSLDFGHVAAFDDSFPAFARLRRAAAREDLRYQVGIPGDLDMALFTLGPAGAFRHRAAFRAATVREIQDIHAKAGSSVLFQLEVPAELVFVSQLPRPVQPAMAAFLARGVCQLAALSPEGARFGIHLCVGDLGNKALGRMRDTRPLVTLTNAIVRRWPHGRPLAYVHVPLAAGDQPAPLDEAFYRPLSRLRLPPDVRFVAGFVHEHGSLDDQRHILRGVEHRLGRRVDVATACGLGRRTPDAAAIAMEMAGRLARDPA